MMIMMGMVAPIVSDGSDNIDLKYYMVRWRWYDEVLQDVIVTIKTVGLNFRLIDIVSRYSIMVLY